VTGWKIYDDKGRVIVTYEPFSGFGYDYQAPTAAVLAGLAAVTTIYDPRGMAILVTAADGSQTITLPGIPADLADPSAYTPSPWVNFRYDADDNAGRTHPGTSAGWSDQYNTPVSTTVDALGRAVTRTEHHAPNSTSTTSTAYDIDGNITAVTEPLGRVALSTDYDKMKRPWRRHGIDHGTVSTAPDPAGTAIETRDDKGSIRLTAYDHAHRPVLEWAADAAAVAPTLRRVVVYGDQPDSGLPPEQAAAANLLGRICRSYDEAGLLTSAGFDMDGNELGTTRRVLRTDLILSGLPSGPGTWTDTAYVVDWQPQTGQTLDQHAGALIDPTPYSVDLVFDALRRVRTRTGPLDVTGARTTLAYAYNPGGQPTSVSSGTTSYLSQALYNARGQCVLALHGPVLVRCCYDPATFRLTRLRAEPATATPTPLTWSPVAGPSAVLQDYGYAYDLTGNPLTLRDRTPGAGLPVGADPAHSPGPDALDRQFTYDGLYRLSTATGRETVVAPTSPWLDTPAGTDITKARPYLETYQYDQAGNLLNLKHTSASGYTRGYGLTQGSNALATVTIGNAAFAYTYDPSGNLTSEAGVRRFEWDHADRCSTFRIQTDGAVPSLYAQYRYDAAGQRVVKVVKRQGDAPDVTVRLDGVFESLVLSAAEPASTRHDTTHVYAGEARIAVLRHGAPVPGDPYPQATYHLPDHLGSTAAVLDANGVLLNREEFTPYGETSFGSYPHKRYRFTAKERDEESGLNYHGLRYFAPWLGRWLSCDPAGLRDGPASYTYVGDNPLRRVDPTGAAGASAAAVQAAPEPVADLTSQVDQTFLDSLPKTAANDTAASAAETAAESVATKAATRGLSVGARLVEGLGLAFVIGVAVEAGVDASEKWYQVYKAYREVKQTQADIAEQTALNAARDLQQRFDLHISLTHEPRDDSAALRAFRRFINKDLKSDPCAGLRPSGGKSLRQALSRIKWDAGHSVARVFGGTMLAIERRSVNRNSTAERKGINIPKPLVNICGFPMTQDTLLYLLEQKGLDEQLVMQALEMGEVRGWEYKSELNTMFRELWNKAAKEYMLRR
jgi:RHS repeat-associated protein